MLAVVVVPFLCAMALTFVAALLVLLILLAVRIALVPVAVARHVGLRSWFRPPFDRFRGICSAIPVIAERLAELVDRLPPAHRMPRR